MNRKALTTAQRRRWKLGCVLSVLASAWCHGALAEDSAAPLPAASADYPACRSGLQLRAVLYDAKAPERSFAVFGAGQTLRRGSRIGEYQIASIEQGTVLLTASTQRCSLRLRSARAKAEPGVIPVAAVRSALQARRSATRAAAMRAVEGESLAARTENLQASVN